MAELDDTDRALLNRIQSNFPVTPRPYLTIAQELGLTEKDVLHRIARLRRELIIRRIGGNFVPEKLGFVSTLCAANVPENQIERFAEIVNRYPGVTHNYWRDSIFNVWFTFIAPSMEEIDANLKKIAEESGITDIINLPSTRVFKIRAQFDL